MSDLNITLCWFEFSFPSLRLVVLLRLKNSVCPAIYPLADRRRNAFMPFLKAILKVSSHVIPLCVGHTVRIQFTAKISCFSKINARGLIFIYFFK